jgi:predicted GNAT family acetyltransferase
MSDATVQQDSEKGEFFVEEGGERAVLDYHLIGDRAILLQHTEVPPDLRHRGLANALAHAALEHARAKGYTVIATCPFVLQYLSRHPEYRTLVKTKSSSEREPSP